MKKTTVREPAKKVETANNTSETTDSEILAVFNALESFQALTSSRTLAIKAVITTRTSTRLLLDASPKSPKALVKYLA